MLIVISAEEAAQAAQRFGGIGISLKMYDQTTLGVAPSVASGLMQKFGLGDLSYVKLQFEKVENNDIYMRCNSAITMLTPIIANNKMPGLVEVVGNNLVVHPQAVPQAVEVLKSVSLKSISFKDNLIVLDVTIL